MKFDGFTVRAFWKTIDTNKIKNSKKQNRKSNERSMNNHQKRESKLSRKPWKNHPKNDTFFEDPQKTFFWGALEIRRPGSGVEGYSQGHLVTILQGNKATPRIRGYKARIRLWLEQVPPQPGGPHKSRHTGNLLIFGPSGRADNYCDYCTPRSARGVEIVGFLVGERLCRLLAERRFYIV